MNKISLVALLIFFAFNLGAQTDISKKIEHGLSLSTKLDMENGYGLGVGYYFLKPLFKKSLLSIDLNLYSTQFNRDYENVIDINSFISLEPGVITRTGRLEYSEISVQVPLKYRFKFKAQGSFFAYTGLNLNYTIRHSSIWNFVETSTIEETDEIINEISGQEEVMNSSNLSAGLFIGIGYRKNKLMIEIGIESIRKNVNNAFLFSLDQRLVSLNLYYRISE